MDIGTVQGEVRARAAGGITGPSAPQANRENSRDLMGLGKSDFLKLLVAQLRNQDPLKPMEDKEFIAQMAQLNTVEQITEMNAMLSLFLGIEEMTQASALIGKTIEAAPPGTGAVRGIVKEVRMEQGRPVLIVGGQEVELADVLKIISTT